MIIPACLFLAQVVNRPPAIAHAAGFIVGVTTREGYERRYGKGFAFTGGHPDGARSWRLKGADATITIDPFDYSPNGLVVDLLDVRFEPKYGDLPLVAVKKADLGLLAKIKKGMGRKEVEHALEGALEGNALTQTGLVRYKERLVNSSTDRYTTWKVDLSFDKAKGSESLSGFRITCS